MSDTIDISHLNKAEVLAALYNASKPQGLGMLHFSPAPMTTEEAAELLGRQASPHEIYFDYLKGRVMKVNLLPNQLDPFLYDRDNGKGAAARAIAGLQKQVSA